MKLQSRLSLRPKHLGATLLAFLMCLGTSARANAERSTLQYNNFQAGESRRALRQEARSQFRANRQQDRQTRMLETRASAASSMQQVRLITPIATSNIVLYPGQMSAFRTTRPHLARAIRLGATTYVDQSGKAKNLNHGASMDFSSTVANIMVGSNLLTGSTTITVGDETRQLSAGSKVTAAEFAALNSKLATGEQGLVLNKDGAAVGGHLDLNIVSNDGATIRASELVVPEKVSVTGDFGRNAEGIRVTKDLVNYGSINAISSDVNKHSAVIAARDINNAEGGLISSESTDGLNLSLRADRDLSNAGAIRSSGDLELTAGNSISNLSDVQAKGDIVLNSAEIVNHGSINSLNRSITLTGGPDSDLTVDNRLGTFSAANGGINLRSLDYSGTGDSTIYGGDLLSRDLNVSSGQGTGNVTVNQLTGTVNTKGAAAHVNSNTSDLVLGTQCLTGDPTYYNTGNVILGGNVDVGETLAIIAGGNITTNVTNLTIRARSAAGQGFGINIIAGANITAGSGEISPPGGPATLPAQSTGSISQNATAPVTISGASATGGNIDFTAATSGLFVDGGSTASNFNGANVTFAAFASAGGANGRILANTGGAHQIFAAGNGTGNNGNVSLIAGATSGQAIQIGAIHNFNGTGIAAGTGATVLANAQPTTSNGSPITFNTQGAITSGNTIVASSTIGGGSVSIGNFETRKLVTIRSGSNATVGDITAGDDLVKIFSGGDLSVAAINSSNSNSNLFKVELLSQGNITFSQQIRANDGILVVAGKSLITAASGSPSIFTEKSGNTGDLTLVAGAAFQDNGTNVTITGQSATGGSILFQNGAQIQKLSASSPNNGDAGDINLIAFNGTIELPTSFAFSVNANRNGTGVNSGNINIVAGANVLDAIDIGGVVSRGGSSNYTGSMTISASTPNATAGSPVVLSAGAGFGGVTSGTFLGGAITSNSSVNITRSLDSNGAAITINGGAGGVFFGDVSEFGNMQVTSLGDITVLGGINVSVAGAGDNQNTLIWTALGDIAFDTRFNLHSSGGGGTATGGGGGVALVAGGNITSVLNPLGPEAASIQTTSGANGGNILVVAGAAFTRSANSITITGPSITSGFINFDGTAVNGDPLRHIDSHSQGVVPGFNNGGDITLISYGNLIVNPNLVPPPVPIFFSAAGSGTGSNGLVTIVTGGSLQLPKIDMGANGGGIIIRAGQASSTTFDLTAFSNGFATISAGSPLNGTLVATPININNPFNTPAKGSTLAVASAANVTLGNIDLSSNVANLAGGTLSVVSGANVSIGTVNVSNTSANGAGGIIDIQSNSSTALNVGGGGINGTGTLTANASATTGDGGAVRITNTGTGGVLITSVPSSTVTNGSGASLELDAGTGNLNLTALGAAINRSGVGTNKAGGSILLKYGSLTAPAGAITLTANATGTGAGGDITVQTTTNTNLTIGSAAGNYIVSNSGTGGTVDFHAGGAFTLAATGSVNADNVFFETDAGAITINTAITAKDVRLSSGAAVILNAAITADPITILAQQNITLNNLTADGGILVVAGGNIGATSAVAINGSNSTGDGGNIVMIAGANYTDNGDDVTITSAKGGSIDFTSGGGSLTSLTTSSSFLNGSAGDMTLLALESGAGTGRILLSPITVTAGGNGTGQNGDVVMLGSASSGASVSVAAVSTSGGSGILGGDITLGSAVSNFAGAGPIQKSNASYTGSFVGGVPRGGNIIFTDLTTNGGATTTLSGGGSITGNGIIANGGAVSVTSGSSGAVSINGTGILSNGVGTNNGGAINVVSGTGGLTLSVLSATGGGSGAGGGGGAVAVQANSASLLTLPTINVSGGGTTGGAGSINVSNSGSGGIGITNSSFNMGGNGAGGQLVVDATTGAVDGVVSITGPLTLNVGAGGGLSNGSITIAGSSIASTNSLTFTGNSGAAGTGNLTLTTTSGDVTVAGSVAFNFRNNIALNIAGGDLSTSGVAGGSIGLTASGNLTGGVNLNSSSTGGNNPGGAITTSSGGAQTLGTVTASGNGTGAGAAVTLVSGGALTVGAITTLGSTGGAVALTSTNANITESGTINTGGTGALTVTLAGGTPGNANFGTPVNVSMLTGVGGGTITLNNGASALQLGSLGGTQSVVLTATNAATGIVATSNISTTGTMTLNTPRFFNDKTISAASITVQNLTGNLVVDGGASGSLTGTVPTAGTPGNPSSPTAINFNTVSGGTLNLFGDMALAGDVTMNNTAGTTTSNAGSLFHGTNNVVLITNTWTQLGGGNITGNDFILSGLSIINPDGDVNIASNLTFVGRDLTIAARNNINFTGTLSITLSNAIGSAGDLTMIAGYNLTPTGGGQQQTTGTFTVTGPSTGGGSINGANVTIDTSSSGSLKSGGNVLAVAQSGTTNSGSINLGSITTSSTTGIAGSVTVIGSGNITTGAITAVPGNGTANTVTVTAGNSAISGTPTISRGSLTGGGFALTTSTAGDVALGAVNTGNGNLTVSSGTGDLTFNGGLSGRQFALSTDGGVLTLTSGSILAGTFAGGVGGIINISAGSLVNPGTLVLTATGTGSGKGGQISINTVQDLIVGSSDDILIDVSGPGAGGSVDIQSEGNITVNAGGIDAAGASGAGAFLSIHAGTDNTGALNLVDTTFLTSASANATGDGGAILVSGESITFASSITSLQAFNADGFGTGSGGTVSIVTKDQAGWFVGAPAKAPKGAANFLSISAKSGASGGHGGDVTVDVGGNLTVNTASLTATPQGGGGNRDGASYQLVANSTNTKLGKLIILGSLNANAVNAGQAGTIDLFTSNKTTFDIESSKAPKNGIQGTLSATGANGAITVTNTLGGLYVNTSNSLQARDITLNAGGKGSIGSAGTITATGTLTLTSDTGTIGKGGLNISTPNLAVNSGGSASLNSTLNGALTLVDGLQTGSDFELNAIGQVTVQNVSVLDGSITINSGAGTLTVVANSTVQATNGGIILTNSDITNGDILIGDNSSVVTGGKGDNVIIAIGPAPKKGTNPTAPAGINVQTVGKGLAFFGPDTGVVATSTADVNAINKNVIFNNLSSNIATKKITLGTDSVVTADPPSRPVSNMVLTTSSLVGPDALESTVQMPDLISEPATARMDSANILGNIFNASSNVANLISLNNAVLNEDQPSISTESFHSTDEGGRANDLIVDAAFVIERESPLHQFAAANGGSVVALEAPSGNRSSSHDMAYGNGLFAPNFDTTIKTSIGSVELKAGAVALIMQSNGGLSVYDLHDERKNSIVVNVGDKVFSLSPGHQVLISGHAKAAFESVNPLELVQYRNLNHTQLGNGHKAFTAEFSIPSACYAVKPLQQLMSSNHKDALGLAKRIHKTTAIMMSLSPDRGDYVQYFNPKATAMARQ